MNLPVRLGARIQEERIGAIAIRCCFCAELSIADCYKVKVAEHIYVFFNKYHELGSFMRCRCCGNCLELPEGLTPVELEIDDETKASREFIRKSNPALLEKRPIDDLLSVELPDSVSRTQWAIVLGINNEIELQEERSNLLETISPACIVTLILSALGIMLVCLHQEQKNKVALIAGIVVTMLIAWGVIHWIFNALHRLAMQRAVKRYVKQHLTHIDYSICDLIDAAVDLGEEYEKVALYLQLSQGNGLY